MVTERSDSVIIHNLLRDRMNDLRHTLISQLAENPRVSEQMIKALAGHVSGQMLQRYSHKSLCGLPHDSGLLQRQGVIG
jgi:hypothetical protein